MKKSFASTAPKIAQPSLKDIEAFEKGGTGHDKKPKGKISARVEETKRLSLDVPADMHTRFKTACSATNNKMTKEIMIFIAKRTAELEKEAGISHK